MVIYDRANDRMLEVIPTSFALKKKFNLIKEKKLVFRHSHIAITDYTLGDNSEFEKTLSVWDETKWRYRPVVGYYVKDLKEFRLPRSFDTGILAKHFPNYQAIVENDAYPSDKIDIKLLVPPRDDEQRVALAFLCAQGDFKKNYRYTTLMIDSETGSGKTMVTIAAGCFLQAKTVIIVPTSILVDQWKDAYLKFTSLKPADIVTIRGSSKCLKLRNGEYKDKSVFIFITDTIVSFRDQYGDLETMEMFRATGAYLKIIDEIHKDIKAVSMIEAMSNFHMNYYASATPDRSQRKEKWLFKTVYRNCPRFGSKFKTSEEKWTNIMIAKYAFVPTPMQIKRMVHPRKKWLNPKAYEKELIFAPKDQQESFIATFRNLMKWSKRQLRPGNKILILCSTIDGTGFMKELSEKFYPGDVARYYGSMKPKEQKEALTKTVICATSQSLGTGADIKGIQHVYNIMTYSNSIDAGQLPGRARKLEDGTTTWYCELCNFSYLKTFRQYETRKPYLIKKSKTGKLMILE